MNEAATSGRLIGLVPCLAISKLVTAHWLADHGDVARGRFLSKAGIKMERGSKVLPVHGRA